MRPAGSVLRGYDAKRGNAQWLAVDFDASVHETACARGHARAFAVELRKAWRWVVRRGNLARFACACMRWRAYARQMRGDCIRVESQARQFSVHDFKRNVRASARIQCAVALRASAKVKPK